ncbi:hypothetical protein OsI_07229 [Oryza sativa Indica Group]|uniref:Uncharacterized protein n=1 Tax=Oryza sativa subsp. indica TaxID=39946 RepID=B8AHX7_ORYSI|nr:hypothetical protein OsI_07229 [Oryza sativa Indica Group]
MPSLPSTGSHPLLLRHVCVLGNNFHNYVIQAEENRSGPAAKAKLILTALQFSDGTTAHENHQNTAASDSIQIVIVVVIISLIATASVTPRAQPPQLSRATIAQAQETTRHNGLYPPDGVIMDSRSTLPSSNPTAVGSGTLNACLHQIQRSPAPSLLYPMLEKMD